MTEDLKAECNELKGIVHKLREEVSHCEYKLFALLKLMVTLLG